LLVTFGSLLYRQNVVETEVVLTVKDEYDYFLIMNFVCRQIVGPYKPGRERERERERVGGVETKGDGIGEVKVSCGV
jgi:hypothetical protein